MTGGPAVLDVRPAVDFERLHRAGSANIPLEELAGRIHELPPPHRPILVFDECSTRSRWARSRLRVRGRDAVESVWGAAWLEDGSIERGPAGTRLWQPHDLLVAAVAYARGRWESCAGRRALDLACGTGRNAVYLAECGFETDAWDVLPDALERCRDLAGRCGTTVRTRLVDVESDRAIEPGVYDLVCVFCFLHRPLIPSIAQSVRPGGLLVYETFVEPQRARFGKPRRAAFELRRGELRSHFEDWRIVAYREHLSAPRRFVASLIARKPDGRV